MGRVCVGRLCYGPSLQWAEFAMGRDVQLPFKLSIVMPILVPVSFVYKHGSPRSIHRIKRTLRFWFESNWVPGISSAYLYAYSKKSFGYFNYLIGYLHKYAAYQEL